MELFVVGMHRSGTSLMSNYLHKCGINMGDNLANAGVGNKFGHFEDRDFLDLHKKILKYNRSNMYVTDRDYCVKISDYLYAKEIIARKSRKYDKWGCKDPRSTLFLDFWADLLPDAKYLMMYRNPYQVIDSLFRRKGEYMFYFNPWRAAHAWIEYNTRMIEFASRNPKNCQIINIQGFNRDHERSQESLSRFLNIDLSAPYSDVFSAKDISHSMSLVGSIYMPVIDFVHKSALDSVYNELENLSVVNINGLK